MGRLGCGGGEADANFLKFVPAMGWDGMGWGVGGK